MSDLPEEPSPARLFTLHEVRDYLRRSRGWRLAAIIGVFYAIASMVWGGMFVPAHLSGGYTVYVFWGNSLGLQNWNYPGLLIEAPWGFIELPFFATVSMILVSVGVGVGMAVALLLGAQLIRERRASSGRPATAGTIAGLTPAMIALVTLGACCSTTAAATAGVGLVAQSSGSTTSNLLLNNWYLGVFQIAVVYVALVAQELLLRVYGRLFASNDPAYASRETVSRSLDRRAVVVGLARASLLVGGITWVLSVVAAWTVTNPFSAGAGLWFGWIIEHFLVGGLAVVVGLSPRTFVRWVDALERTIPGKGTRAALLVGAWTLAVWVPPPLSGAGVEGFGNEVLGLLGFPASAGAVAPVFPWGLALVLRWTFQYLLLAGFAASVGAAPRATLSWMAEAGPLTTAVRSATPGPATSTAVPVNAR